MRRFRSGPPTSEIRNPDGSVVFQAEGIEVPAEWSQVASDILAQKYFRKAGVPARLAPIAEEGVPSWLWRHTADSRALAALPEAARYGGETDARQIFDRMAGTWTYWGWKGGYFDAEEDARAFYDEIRLMLARQIGAPNSPQWFNTGLHWAYGIDGPAQGHYYVDYRDRRAVRLRQRLRASAAACLLHPVGRRRSRQRGRDHGSLGARGAHLQIRLRLGLEFLEAPRRWRIALGRRALLGADELSCGSATAPPAPSNPAARPGAPPRWSSSTSTIPTSRHLSIGRWSRSRRSRPSSPAPSSPPGI